MFKERRETYSRVQVQRGRENFIELSYHALGYKCNGIEMELNAEIVQNRKFACGIILC